MTDIKEVPALSDPAPSAPALSDPGPSDKLVTKDSAPKNRITNYILLSLIFFVLGFSLVPLVSIAQPHLKSLFNSYINPSSPKGRYDDFRPAQTYTGVEPINAKVCVFSLPNRGDIERPGDENDCLDLADVIVASAFWIPPEDLSHHTFSYRREESPIFLRLHVTHKKYAPCTCDQNGHCPHLKTALYEPFKHMQDEVPGVQCIAAKDSLGNEMSFVWGSDWTFDNDRVREAKCVYDEKTADQCWAVGVGLGVMSRDQLFSRGV